MATQQARVLVIGGTGTVGRTLVDELAQRGAQVSVATRDPKKVKARDGKEVVSGVGLDLGDAGTFAGALAGVDRVFVLAPAGHAQQDALLAPFLAAALGRVQKVVTMTAAGVEHDDALPLRKVELQVAQSGVTTVHLRPSWFSQNFNSYWYGGIVNAGVVALPAADSRTAFVDARDIAAVAAVALTTSSLDGQALTLTGPEALTYTDAAAALSDAGGRAIRYVAVDDDSFRAGAVAAGLPADYADVLVRLFAVVRAGHAAHVDDAVARVLGRARSLRDYARDHAALFRATASQTTRA